MRARLAAAATAAIVAAAVAAGPASASAVGVVQAKRQPAPAAEQPRGDDAEQRGHVIPDEPQRREPTPAPAPVPPSTPPVSASPARAASSPATPTAAPVRPELPRTGANDGTLLAFLGLMLAGAGVSLRRAIA